MEHTDKIIVNQINKRLFEDFGRSLDGRPIWRITWTSTEFELKRGEHEEWTPSGMLFIRKWYGVKNCLKYSYVMDRWALERLTYLGDAKIAQMELVEARRGTYEPVYVFQDPNGQPLPVSWRFCELVMKNLAAGPGYSSPTAREDMRRAMEDAEVEDMAAYLGEAGRSDLFAFENSVSLSGMRKV